MRRPTWRARLVVHLPALALAAAVIVAAIIAGIILLPFVADFGYTY